jgi:glucokinase
MNTNDEYIAGVDIGGSHITVALVDLKTREIIENTLVRKSINAKEAADYLIQTWATIIKESFGKMNLLPGKVGIAFPGPFNYSKGICLIKEQNKYRSLYRLNLRELLSEQLNIPGENIMFRNDAACFLQGEIYTAPAGQLHNAAGITLGTGLGSAYNINGLAVDAELWKMPFKKGIAEDYLSGRGIIQLYNEITGNTAENVKEIVDRYKTNNDPLIALTFQRFGELMGEFIVKLTEENNIQHIILGGNITKTWNLFAPALKKLLEKEQISIAVRPTSLGEKAVMLGAVGFMQAVSTNNA